MTDCCFPNPDALSGAIAGKLGHEPGRENVGPPFPSSDLSPPGVRRSLSWRLRGRPDCVSGLVDVSPIPPSSNRAPIMTVQGGEKPFVLRENAERLRDAFRLSALGMGAQLKNLVSAT